jgi:hypothetical protein
MRVTLVVGEGLEDDDRAEAATGLREELLDLDVEAVEFATLDLLDGSKAGDILAWGTLVASIASVASMRVLVDALASWIRRQPRDITVEIDGAKLTGAVSPAERERLVASFETRLRQSGPPSDSPAASAPRPGSEQSGM